MDQRNQSQKKRYSIVYRHCLSCFHKVRMNLFKKNKKRFITRRCMNSDYSSELRGIFYIL